MKFVGRYLVALLTLLVLDGLWLGVVAIGFYQKEVGALLLPSPIWAAAILFYMVHAAGIVAFPVQLALPSSSWIPAAVYGAFFGLCAYATYDLTNLATLRGWTVTITVVDIAWGMFATAAATLVVCRIPALR